MDQFEHALAQLEAATDLFRDAIDQMAYLNGHCDPDCSYCHPQEYVGHVEVERCQECGVPGRNQPLRDRDGALWCMSHY